MWNYQIVFLLLKITEQISLKLYKYVGAKEIKLSVANYPIGTQIKSQTDIKRWVDKTRQKPNKFGYIEATFIIDKTGYLRIADRHSEHIACSGGNPVLSAGEILFFLNKNQYEIAEISNQSTGFCPEPISWFWVSQALDKIPINHPGGFTIEFEFRRCTKCGQLNVIKGDWFVCDVCEAYLSPSWNCDLE